MTQPRLVRETKTIQMMIQLYCKANHRNKDLCEQCSALLHYAQKRLDHCPFGAEKPTCNRCRIHCYQPDMRAAIKQVMRYAGPKMLFRHPIIAIRHLLDKIDRRKVSL